MKKLLLSIVLLLSVACSACGCLQGKNLQAQSIVLLLMEGKEVYRGSQFIDLEELMYNINRYIQLIDQ